MAMRKLYKFKRWYSIDEAAARLSMTLSETVTADDIIQLAAEGHIKSHWFLNGDYFARPAILYCSYEPGETRGTVLSYPIEDEFTIQLSGICWLPVELCTSWGWWLLTFIGKGGESGSFCGAIVIDESGCTWELIEPKTGDFFHFPRRDEIVLTAESIEEFEQNAASVQTTQIGPAADTGLGAKERESLLKQIGALAALLSTYSNAYKRGGRPNASQIASAVGTLVEQMPDANLHGLGQSNIRGNITEGLSLLRS